MYLFGVGAGHGAEGAWAGRRYSGRESTRNDHERRDGHPKRLQEPRKTEWHTCTVVCPQ